MKQLWPFLSLRRESYHLPLRPSPPSDRMEPHGGEEREAQAGHPAGAHGRRGPQAGSADRQADARGRRRDPDAFADASAWDQGAAEERPGGAGAGDPAGRVFTGSRAAESRLSDTQALQTY